MAHAYPPDRPREGKWRQKNNLGLILRHTLGQSWPELNISSTAVNGTGPLGHEESQQLVIKKLTCG